MSVDISVRRSSIKILLQDLEALDISRHLYLPLETQKPARSGRCGLHTEEKTGMLGGLPRLILSSWYSDSTLTASMAEATMETSEP
jgi:hypothetical protein